MKTELELELLEAEGKTCEDCQHSDLCGVEQALICFGFKEETDELSTKP